MFQIGTSAAPKAAVSALSALAAIGASGMASELKAATMEYDPSQAVRVQNSAYCIPNWVDWLADGTSWYGIGATKYGFVAWEDLDFTGMDPIEKAKFKIQKSHANSSYFGAPDSAHMQFALITQAWSSGTPPAAQSGPTIDASSAISVPNTLEAAGLYTELDITPLLVEWQAHPESYYGIRFYWDSPQGGMASPNSPEAGGGITGDLILTTTGVPEPTSLALLGVGGFLALRRRNS